MDPTTPEKPRSMPPVGDNDDDTSVTNAPAPSWDAAETSGDTAPGMEQRITQQTSAIALKEYELGPGMKLGEYQLEQKLGQGGMGVVYAAVHPLIGKRAAIKILKKELCADPGSLERFVDEARVVNQIGHPNIVDVFAFGEMPDGRSYFVMELLKGESLRARLARSKLTLDEVRNIVKPLARALQAAHDKGVIHRDLKPDNVFLVEAPDAEPTAKLLDFGIAKLAKNDHRVEKTATGAIVGTPQYIAPEQAKGYAVDPRADVYALGAILFELLTGRPPFVADNAMEMVAKHLMEAPVRPSTLIHAVSPELDDLVLRMLAKTPDGRPSLGEVIAVVERSRASAATLPVDRLTPPPPRSDPSAAIPSRPVSEPMPAEDTTVDKSSPTVLPTFDTVPSPDTWSPRRRAKWIVPTILGVPIVAVAAFLVVSKLGASEPSKPADESRVEPVEVDKPATAGPKVDEPLKTDEIEPEDQPPVEKTVDRPVVRPAVKDGDPRKKDPSKITKKDSPDEASRKNDPPKIKKPPLKKDPPTKDPPKKDPLPVKKDPKKDPAPPKKDFTLPEGDGLATPVKN